MTTRVCEECGGTGFKKKRYHPKQRIKPSQTARTILCSKCDGTGRIHESMPLPEAADWKEKL